MYRLLVQGIKRRYCEVDNFLHVSISHLFLIFSFTRSHCRSLISHWIEDVVNSDSIIWQRTADEERRNLVAAGRISLRLFLDYADEKDRGGESSVWWVGIGSFRRRRANHSVANAGNPSQGQDQSVNPIQSAEGLAPCTTNNSVSPFVHNSRILVCVLFRASTWYA